MKEFWLLESQLTAEDEELTPTMKLKRKLVQPKYASQIERDVPNLRADPPGDSRVKIRALAAAI
ncbi:MAG: hypothetical protein IPM99_07425 [Rubrivivax sp.]|nr:hypothetical protein [Rubrivivax sp.]